jgi:hypothetical protein
MIQVTSSNVDSLGFSDGTLYVKWKSGRFSSYAGVPADVAEKAAKSWSVGTFVRENIVGQYSHRYVADE